MLSSLNLHDLCLHDSNTKGELQGIETPTSLFIEGLGTSLGKNAEENVLLLSRKDVTSEQDVIMAIKNSWELSTLEGDVTLRNASDI